MSSPDLRVPGTSFSKQKLPTAPVLDVKGRLVLQAEAFYTSQVLWLSVYAYTGNVTYFTGNVPYFTGKFKGLCDVPRVTRQVITRVAVDKSYAKDDSMCKTQLDALVHLTAARFGLDFVLKE